MSRYGTFTSGPNVIALQAQSSLAEDLQAQTMAKIAALPAGYVVVDIALAGAGDGFEFMVNIEAVPTADVLSGGFAAPPSLVFYQASEASALGVARRLASPPSGPVADSQLVGASQGTRFMGMLVLGTLAGADGGIDRRVTFAGGVQQTAFTPFPFAAGPNLPATVLSLPFAAEGGEFADFLATLQLVDKVPDTQPPLFVVVTLGGVPITAAVPLEFVQHQAPFAKIRVSSNAQTLPDGVSTKVLWDTVSTILPVANFPFVPPSTNLVIPQPGSYQIEAGINISNQSGNTLSGLVAKIFRNATLVEQINITDALASPPGGLDGIALSATIDCLQNDIITVEVQPTGADVTSQGDGQTWLSIAQSQQGISDTVAAIQAFVDPVVAGNHVLALVIAPAVNPAVPTIYTIGHAALGGELYAPP